jgi:hypothetical protein
MVGGSEDEKFLDYYTCPQLVDASASTTFGYLAGEYPAIREGYTRERTTTYAPAYTV